MRFLDELSQWCEIYGHEWVIIYIRYGLVLGKKETHLIDRTCRNCLIKDDKLLVMK